MSPKAAPPSVYCEDFAFVPRAGYGGKPRVSFSRPVNLLSAASAAGGAAAQTTSAHVLVLNLDGQLYIRDLTGSALLQLNDKPVVEGRLNHGDRVRLGKIEYEVFATRFAPASANGQAAAIPAAAELLPTGGGEPRPVRGAVTLVGACEQAELRLRTPGAPQACAIILRLGAGYWLWNLDPALPCRINGAPVVRAPLPDRGVLTIGEEGFRFRVIPRGSAPAKPAAVTPPVAAKPTPRTPVPAASPPAAPTPTAQEKVVTAVAKPAAPVPAKRAATASAPALPPEPRAAPAPIVADPLPLATSPAGGPAAGPAPAPAAASQAKRAADEAALDDDADVFKQWGPLAFAVAAADRPELQAGGSRSGKVAAAATDVEPAPGGRFILKLLVALIVLGVLTVGAFVAWKYGRRYLHF